MVFLQARYVAKRYFVKVGEKYLQELNRVIPNTRCGVSTINGMIMNFNILPAIW